MIHPFRKKMSFPMQSTIGKPTKAFLNFQELVLSDECDLATVHALLSKIPVDIPFEKLLVVSRNLYKR